MIRVGSKFDSFPYRDLLRQVLDSDYRRKKKMAGRHIAIATWLDALSMSEYLPLFHQYGGVEDLIYASESEIKDLGIRVGAHRAKILSSLRILRDKYEKGRVTGSGLFSLQRTNSFPSSSVPTSPTGPSPDFQHLIISPEKLQLDLQRELAGDPSDLRSRPWYHGNITRQHAETIVCGNGDFIVRDCISKPGDFVLTCKWKGAPLSFMINSIVGSCAPGQLPVVSYQFEEDAFPTIQELIQYYQHRGKPVTQVSGALLKNPIARSMPLSYYDTKYGASNNNSTGIYATPDQSPRPSPFVTPSGSPISSPEMHRRGRWTGSQPLLNIIESEDSQTISRNRDSRSSSLDRCDSLPVINITPASDLVEPKAPVPALLKPTINHTRSGSAPALVDNLNGDSPRKYSSLGRRKLAPAISESELSCPPPPKPSRIPSVKYKQKPSVQVRHKVEDDDDRDYSDYFQVKQEPSWLQTTPELSPSTPVPSPSAEEVSLRHMSSEDHAHEQSRRVKREKVFFPANPLDLLSPNTKQSFSNSLPQPESQAGSQRIQSRILPASSAVPSAQIPSSTSQLVARSRSFRYAHQKDKSRESKGYLTLPAKSSRTKTLRAEPASEKIVVDSDYDVPKEHAVDHDPLVFQYVEYLKSRQLIQPPKVCLSSIEPETFQSDLLPQGHKALDSNVLHNVKTLLLNKTPRCIAMHLTRYDITLVNATNEKDLGLGVFSGLELLTLPQGKQLRQDVIERWECLRLFAMVSLLTIQTVNERAKMLSLWIQICLDLKLAAGNLFSFTAIMSALTGVQLNRLTDTWLVLRQNHTASAYNFDTKLRPAYKSLNDGSSDLPLNNETVPYITPVCFLLERELDTVLLDFFWEVGLDPIANAIDVLFTHLDTARVIASQGDLYRTTSSSLVANWNFEPELSQVLRPEFHLLAIWGAKGCAARRKDRVEKLEQILSLLSHKLQVPGDDGTEV